MLTGTYGDDFPFSRTVAHSLVHMLDIFLHVAYDVVRPLGHVKLEQAGLVVQRTE